MAEQGITKFGKKDIDELSEYYGYDLKARKVHEIELRAVNTFGRNPQKSNL
ncbi:MAG: hypothetical protein ABIA76_00360 [Candidatus Diapherotrites archaeon]